MLEVDSVDLITPPPADDDPGAATTGITGFQFPEWFITQGLESQRVAHPFERGFWCTAKH